MKIQVTFDSFDEFEAFREGANAPVEKPNAPKTKATAPVEKPNAPKTEAPAPAKEIPDIAEVRAALSELNDKTGRNRAKELITDLGCASLAKVPEEKYAELLSAAREELNA